MIIYSRNEIEYIRDAALTASNALQIASEHIKQGVTPLRISRLAREFILRNGATPYSIKTSVNEVIAHGIPSENPIRNGDILTLDIVVSKNGFFGDCAYTFPVGSIDDTTSKLIAVTKRSLFKGIEMMISGNKTGDIGHEIENYISRFGFKIIKEASGHGIGRNMHEPPQIHNFGKPGQGWPLLEGMVLAIEPIATSGSGKTHSRINTSSSDLITYDRKPSAHFEHTVAIINGHPQILSTFDYIEKGFSPSQSIIELF